MLCNSGIARLLVLAGHLLYASLLASRLRVLYARLCGDLSGTNMVLWRGTGPHRPALRYATAVQTWARIGK